MPPPFPFVERPRHGLPQQSLMPCRYQARRIRRRLKPITSDDTLRPESAVPRSAAISALLLKIEPDSRTTCRAPGYRIVDSDETKCCKQSIRISRIPNTATPREKVDCGLPGLLEQRYRNHGRSFFLPHNSAFGKTIGM